MDNKKIPMLDMRSITKYIYNDQGKGIVESGIKILDSVDFDLYSGEVHVIVGENGAGKSTLMNVLGGIIEPDGGAIYMDGQETRIPNTATAKKLGIGFIHQEMNLCPNRDIAHNIFLGREIKNKFGLTDVKEMRRQSSEMLNKLGFNLDPKLRLSTLSTAMQQIVEITKVLSTSTKIIIMDEPTATLTSKEIEILFDLIRNLRAQGMGIIYISHRMEEIEDLGDRYTVLRDGKMVGKLTKAEYSRDKIISMMAGRVVNTMYKSTHVPTNEVVLDVKGIKVGKATQPFDFHVNKGEVVSFGGLVGAGRTELAKSIFGARHLYGGTIEYLGEKYEKPTVRKSIKKGISYLTEDRKVEGLVLQKSIKQNVSIASLDKLTNHSVINFSKEEALSKQMIENFNVVCTGSDHVTGALSGGNQQKVCLAKWFATEPKLLILDEPTRGVDVNAKAQIYEIIDNVAKEGMAVMVITSDMHELLSISDRIYILHEGDLVAEIQEKEEMTQERILRHLLNTD